ncbi:hypothetical protein QWJ26_39540 [Streptomyces sp. CSDS2]|uniref:hypothetical protein n=1 Tax=Streptomyces sp. CSDS2 TaxID=3055051 RepID=UPI0025AF4413|nr:hypothetical protein [Streptomyces sp. CSDS2]MDN3265787.1 hypothetical protein [Streptomyces sp. CSDS2]
MVTVIAATTAGCAQSGVADTPVPATTAKARQAVPEPLTWRQELRITDALQRLTKQCMNRHGFAYWEERTLNLRESHPVPYVQDDVSWARTYGYGGRIDVKSERARERNPIGTYRESLPPARRAAFDTALDGGADSRILTAPLPAGGAIRKRIGGCTEEAERTLYGDPAEWFRTSKIAMNLSALYRTDLMKDHRLIMALRAWSRCMKKAGQPYPDPQAARDAARVNTSRLGTARADEAFAAERETAVADATCARRTSLRAVAKDRERYYRNRLRNRFGKDLDTYHRLGLRAYNQAVHIVPERD